MSTTLPNTTITTTLMNSNTMGNIIASNITAANITAANPPNFTNGTFTVSSGTLYGGAGTYYGTATAASQDFKLYRPGTVEVLLTVEKNGTVRWHDDILDTDAAAEAFKRSVELGVELKAGISNAVKLRMRDSVFEDLINLAKERGPLTAEDLTYFMEASKIVERLANIK